MKKWIFRILIVLVVLVVAAFFARNFLAKQSIERGVTKITGFPLEIASVDLGIFQSHIEVHGLKMQNPADFPEKMFVDLPGFVVDYKFGSMISGEPHINELSMDLKELVVVKNAKGESNLQRLKGATASGEKEPTSKPATKTKYHVDTLHFKVGTVLVKDYSGTQPTTRTIRVNIDKTYKNINDGTDITRLVLLDLSVELAKAGISGLGIDVGELSKSLAGVTDAAGAAIKSGREAIEKATENIFKEIPGLGGGKKK